VRLPIGGDDRRLAGRAAAALAAGALAAEGGVVHLDAAGSDCRRPK
jgi:hypothetical protein